MYEIENKSDIYVIYDTWKEVRRGSQKTVLKKIGTEKQLVVFIAEGFRFYGFKDDTGQDEYLISNPRLEYEYFDGYGRAICAFVYYDDALQFYEEHIKTGLHTQKKPNYRSRWYERYKYEFRHGNVECIRKTRGGPYVKPRRIKAAKAPYLNPEEKPYLRGSISDYPEGWWDDWTRCNERNWKSQRKTRHQWKEKRPSDKDGLSFVFLL